MGGDDRANQLRASRRGDLSATVLQVGLFHGMNQIAFAVTVAFIVGISHSRFWMSCGSRDSPVITTTGCEWAAAPPGMANPAGGNDQRGF
jgi:hypothetical protein